MSPAMRRRHDKWVVAALVLAAATVVGHHVAGRFLILAAMAVVCIRWPVRRLVLWFLALSLALEDTTARPFRGNWTSPVQHLGDLWFKNISSVVPGTPLRVSPFILVSVWMLVRVAASRTGPGMAKCPPTLRPRPEVSAALFAVTGVIVVGIVYGGITHGNGQQAYYQVGALFAMAALVGVTSCVADLPVRRAIATIVMTVATYRAGLVVYLYFTRVRHMPDPPLFVTAHADSLLWAAALCWLFSRVVEHQALRTRVQFLAGGTLMGFALVVNNRRLAWVIVVAGVLFVLLSAGGSARRRLRRVMPVAAPLMVIYVALAMAAPPARVFAPAQAMKSVITGDDSSSVTRKIENFNLVFTMRNNLPTGTGFGHSYIELIRADDISEFFAQYQYIPHNSILGVMMWVGPIGLALIMMPTMLSIRAATLVTRDCNDRFHRSLMAMSFAALAGLLIQGWGDIGLQTPLCVALAGVLGGAAIASQSTLQAAALPDRPVAAARQGT